MAHTVSSILSDDTLNRIIAIESRGKLRAKAPTSSALGLFQFLNATWVATVKKHRPDLAQGRSTQQLLALRVDGTVCIELGARFTEDNAEGIGAGFTDGDLYLAHFLGLGAARKFFRAPPGTSAEQLAGPAAVAANKSILQGKTAGQVRAWAQKSMVTRWEQAGKVNWIEQYYDASSPLADTAANVEHEVLSDEDASPNKVEGDFDYSTLDDIPAEQPVVVQKRRPQIVEDIRDAADDNPGIVTTVKSAFKSKIVWLAGLLGFGGSGSAVSSDPGVQSTLMSLVTKPAFLFAMLAIAATAGIIFFYWKDHGKGAIK